MCMRVWFVSVFISDESLRVDQRGPAHPPARAIRTHACALIPWCDCVHTPQSPWSTHTHTHTHTRTHTHTTPCFLPTQVLAEGIAIARDIFGEGKTSQEESAVAFYFVSYILIVAVGLLNVVVAVLLDEFQSHVRRENEKVQKAILDDEERRKIKGCLDPLTKGLLTFEDEADLTCRIDEIYSKLDEDGSGGLAFEEFREGVKWLSKNIHLTRDDFDVVTENGKHLGPTAEFNREQFQTMMKGELWRYSRRELANVLSVSGDEQFNSTILMLKIMESRNDTTLAEVLRLLRSISDHIQLPAGQRTPALQHLAHQAPRWPTPPSSPNARYSLGTGGGGQGGGGGGGVEGLGELLHKLSSNMEHMSSKMDQMSDKIDRQSSNMEQMSAKIDWQSVVLEDQRAILEHQKAEIKRLSKARARDEAEMQGKGPGAESASLQQVSDRVRPSPVNPPKRKQSRGKSMNELMMLQGYEKSTTALQGRRGRNGDRMEGGDLLSDPSTRDMEHVASNEYKTAEDMEHVASDEYKTEKETYQQHLTYEDFKVVDEPYIHIKHHTLTCTCARGDGPCPWCALAQEV
jgi:methyl-accepting chemotaxis protein